MTTAEIKRCHDNFTVLRDKYRRDTATLMEREEYFHLLETLPVDLMDDSEWRAEWDAREEIVFSEEDRVRCQQIVMKLMSHIGQEMDVDRDMIMARETTQKRSRFKSVRFVLMSILMLGVSGIGFYDHVPGIYDYGVASAAAASGIHCDDVTIPELKKREEKWLATAGGGRRVDWPEGSTVVLNAGSGLTIKNDPRTGGREVTVSGEAFFDMHNDASKPFVVKAKNVVTTVQGTAFNVKTIGDEVVVTVLRGQVQVGDGQYVFGEVTANQQMVVNSVSREHRQSIAIQAEERFWEKEILILGEVPFREAMRRISRRYNVEIDVVNASLDDCTIHLGIFPTEDVHSILDVLSRTVNARVVDRGRRISIVGGSCR